VLASQEGVARAASGYSEFRRAPTLWGQAGSAATLSMANVESQIADGRCAFESQIQNHRPEIQDRKSQIQNRKSKIAEELTAETLCFAQGDSIWQGRARWISALIDRCYSFQSQIQDQKSKITDPEGAATP
jgi:hypothetical protein